MSSEPRPSSGRGLAIGAVAVRVATILVAPGVSGNTRSLLLAGQTHQPGSASTVGDQDGASVSPSSSEPPTIASGKIHESIAREDTNVDTGLVNALIARLEDENADVRRAPAHSLGQLKDSRAVPELIGALKDPEPKVRAAAAEALAEFQEARAIALLTAILSDPSTDVKQSALDALSQFKGNLPSAAIVRLLSDPDPEIRHKLRTS
jgi:HEAT repeat protein